MIHTLRRKFIFIASGCILLILTVVLVCFNAISYYSTYWESMAIVSFIADNNGRLPEENPQNSEVNFFVSPEFRFETRYFSVIVDADDNYIASNNDYISAVTREDADVMYTKALSNEKKRGRIKISDSIFLYQIKEVSGEELNETIFSGNQIPSFLDNSMNYKLIMFLDCTNRFHRIQIMQNRSLMIGAGCLLAFVILVTLFSGRAIRPAAENYAKQKKFITNAGHELKTPLTIISANAEVIEAMHGESEWTQSIRHQVERLTGLVNDLITIARLDESAEKHDTVMKPFDFSALVQKATDEFSTVAVQQGKTLETDIAPKLSLNGNEKTIQELISILLDNAVKYCDDGGVIRTEVKQQKAHICLTVSNTYVEITDCTRFFDHFYRADESHNSEKSGYGIGLSMAETIVRLHKGKITAQQKEQQVQFTVIL